MILLMDLMYGTFLVHDVFPLFQICKHGNGRPGGQCACFILLLSTWCAEIEGQDLLVQIFTWISQGLGGCWGWL